MADRELLELAARAAGYELRYLDDSSILVDGRRWHPLADDGDALRLAVRLCLWVHIDKYGASARRPGDAWLGCEAHKYGGIEATTRRAIVRVAATIGKEQ